MRERFQAAPTFQEFLETAVDYRDLWHSVWKRARVPDDLLARARELPGRWYLLALSGDWCGDAVDPLPMVARLAEEVDGMEFRVVDRDDHLDLMDAHLTDGARSIPIVIVYDEEFREVGWWGPRPAPLQAWVAEAKRDGLSSRERFLASRRWHIRDRGRTTLTEILDLMTVPV